MSFKHPATKIILMIYPKIQKNTELDLICTPTGSPHQFWDNGLNYP
jgi:hypothetical protein